MRKVRGWLIPYLPSRVMPGDFHPITAYLFVEYKRNIDWLVLLVVRQSGQGHDRGRRTALHRLAA